MNHVLDVSAHTLLCLFHLYTLDLVSSLSPSEYAGQAFTSSVPVHNYWTFSEAAELFG